MFCNIIILAATASQLHNHNSATPQLFPDCGLLPTGISFPHFEVMC